MATLKWLFTQLFDSKNIDEVTQELHKTANELSEVKSPTEELNCRLKMYELIIRIITDQNHSSFKENDRLRAENDKLSRKIAKLRAKNVELQEENDKLHDNSSDLTIDQLFETLGSVVSEENAKLRVKSSENGEGTF